MRVGLVARVVCCLRGGEPPELEGLQEGLGQLVQTLRGWLPAPARKLNSPRLRASCTLPEFNVNSTQSHLTPSPPLASSPPVDSPSKATCATDPSFEGSLPGATRKEGFL